VADLVTDLQSAIVTEASFDVTNAQALVWINRRWRAMIGRARAYRKTISVGTTVASTQFYALTGVLEVYEVTVAGVPYSRARRGDAYEDTQGRLVWTGQGETGLFVPDATSTAARGISLIPIPTSSGSAISAFAALEPPDLTADATGDALLAANLDGEFVEALIAGAMAIGYRREGTSSSPGITTRCSMRAPTSSAGSRSAATAAPVRPRSGPTGGQLRHPAGRLQPRDLPGPASAARHRVRRRERSHQR
jgi:hypothetical protein